MPEQTVISMDEAAAKGGLRLYQGQGPNSFRTRMLLAEKGVTLPMVDVRFDKLDHRSPAYLKINSLGQIPALVLDDGTVITESIAICRYFEELNPTPPLFGVGALERAKVEMWLRRIEFEVFATVGNVAFHSDPFFANRLTQFPAFAETEREHLPRKWAWLEGEIADGRPFLTGENLSIADITGAVVAWVAAFFGMEVPADLQHVQRWLERVRSRPSWNIAEAVPSAQAA